MKIQCECGCGEYGNVNCMEYMRPMHTDTDGIKKPSSGNYVLKKHRAFFLHEQVLIDHINLEVRRAHKLPFWRRFATARRIHALQLRLHKRLLPAEECERRARESSRKLLYPKWLGRRITQFHVWRMKRRNKLTQSH